MLWNIDLKLVWKMGFKNGLEERSEDGLEDGFEDSRMMKDERMAWKVAEWFWGWLVEWVKRWKSG